MTKMEHTAREARYTLGGTVQYTYGLPVEAGMAQWCDVSRAGASISLGRYLRPGRELYLEVPSPLTPGALVKVRAQVAWCAPACEAGHFVAGLLVYRDTPEMALDFAAISQWARSTNSAAPKRVFDKPVWKLFPRRSEEGVSIGYAQSQAV